MSIEDILREIRSMSSKVDGLSSEVEAIKQRKRERTEEEIALDNSSSSSLRASRSRSPTRRGKAPRDVRTRPSRSSRRETRRPSPSGATASRRRNSPSPPRRSRSPLTAFSSDEEDGIDSSQLTEVSEQTHRLLTTSCTRRVSNEVRKRTRSRFKLPKVAATRTPRVDHVMKALIPQSAKNADRELAQIQTVVLDPLAPIASLLENYERLSRDEVKDATLAAVELIGNANARISRLRREKLVASINNDLTPLARDDADFVGVAPNLFGPEFSKRAKEHLDQIRCLKTTILPGQQQPGGDRQDDQYNKRPLFRKGHPSGIRGSAREGTEAPLTTTRSKGTERDSPIRTESGRTGPVNFWSPNRPRYNYKLRDSECNSSHGHGAGECDLKPSWPPKPLYNKLAITDKGSVDPEHGERLRNRIRHSAPPIQAATPGTPQPDPATAGEAGNRRALLERGSDGGQPPAHRRLPVHPFSCSEKGWRPEASHQSEGPERLCDHAPFQNGGYPHPQESPTGGGLAGEDRPEGRLFFYTNSSKSQEIPVFPSGPEGLPIQLPSLWPNLSTMGLYQDPEARSSSRTRARDAVDNVHRRLSPDGRVQGESTGPGVRSHISPKVSGFHDKHGEDNHGTITVTGVPGFYDKLTYQGATTPPRENKENTGGVPEAIGGGASISPRPLQAGWQNERHQPSDPTSSTVLQPLTDGPGKSSESSRPGLRNNSDSVPEQQGGVVMVGHSDGQMEWEVSPPEGARPDHRIGRVEPGMGSVLPGDQHRRSLVVSGEDVAHKLPGVTSSHPSPENLCEEQGSSVGTTENRQHNGGGLHQQPGRDSVQPVGLTDQGFVDVVPGEEYPHPGPIPPRGTERDSGQRVTLDDRSFRLDDSPRNILGHQQALWSTGSGPICLQTDQPVPSLFQLAARSICRGNGCLPAGLDGNEGICQPALEPDISCTDENPDTEGGDCTGSPSMEGTTLVSTSAINAGGSTTPPTPSVDQGGTQPTITHRAPVSRLEHLRERFGGQGLSSQASELILQSWRTKTNKSYDSLFGRWNRWCSKRNSDPFSGPVSEIANFLAELYQEGYQYNSVNAYRSAISSVHEKVDGVPVGQHPIITRLVKGIFNARPPVPRYSSTWDVQVVLNYLESCGQSSSLPLKLLSVKTTFLLAITRPSRSADLSQLDIKRLRSHRDGVSFVPTTLAKQSRQGKTIKEFFFPSFPEKVLLCPVDTLSVYLDKTKVLRGEETRLFISFVKPHKAVSSSTVARWLRIMLEQAGIDSSIFGAHSTRGASTSAAARGGVTTEDILKAANWSSESVFQRYYHKEVNRSSYGRAVINQNSSDTASSDISDWTNEAGYEISQSFKKSRRAQKRRESAISEITIDEERNEEAESSRRDLQEESGSDRPKSKGKKTTMKKLIKNGADYSIYWPPNWLKMRNPQVTPYYPQVGDIVVYFHQGHELYKEEVKKQKAYQWKNQQMPRQKHTLKPHEFCQVKNVHFVIGPPTLCSITLTLLSSTSSSASSDNIPSTSQPTTFTFKYHDMDNSLDFLILDSIYKASLHRHWEPGDKFKSLIDGSYWAGTVLTKQSYSEEYPNSFWQCYHVKWDDGATDQLSPWDMEPLDDGQTSLSLPLMAEDPVIAWGGKNEHKRILNGFRKIMEVMEEAEMFINPVDLEEEVVYCTVVPFPTDLSTITERLANGFYRRKLALIWEVILLSRNASSYNEERSHIVQNSKILTQTLVKFIQSPTCTDPLKCYQPEVNDNGTPLEVTAPDYIPTIDTDDMDVFFDDIPNSSSKKRRIKNMSSDEEKDDNTVTAANTEAWRTLAKSIIDEIYSHEDSYPFIDAVDTDMYPDYLNVISHPMDLSTVNSRLIDGYYPTPAGFVNDVNLIFNNAKSYNREKSQIYKMASELQNLFNTKVMNVLHFPASDKHTHNYRTRLALERIAVSLDSLNEETSPLENDEDNINNDKLINGHGGSDRSSVGSDASYDNEEEEEGEELMEEVMEEVMEEEEEVMDQVTMTRERMTRSKARTIAIQNEVRPIAKRRRKRRAMAADSNDLKRRRMMTRSTRSSISRQQRWSPSNEGEDEACTSSDDNNEPLIRVTRAGRISCPRLRN